MEAGVQKSSIRLASGAFGSLFWASSAKWGETTLQQILVKTKEDNPYIEAD